MATTEMSKIGKRGVLVLPASLRKRLGLQEGSYVITEECEDGILIRPAVVLPYEPYTPERVAEFLLGSAIDADSYAEAVAEVRRMGLDPDQINHFKPNGV